MLLWALLWVVMALATSVASGIVVLVTACLVIACYGIGESIVAVIVDPTVSDIAPPHLLGLYMSALTLVWNIGLIIGPIFGGAMMQLYPPVFWPLLACLLLLAGLSAIGLRRDLPASARIVQTT
jgi:MFS family permease